LLINRIEKTEQIFLTDASFLLSYQHIVDNLLKHQYGVVNERGDYSWKGIKRRTEEDSTEPEPIKVKGKLKWIKEVKNDFIGNMELAEMMDDVKWAKLG
jgi:hypothetical protein